MPWKCGECGAIENQNRTKTRDGEEVAQIEAVCHHCGKLLCQGDCFLIKDNSFYSRKIVAYHCEACRKTFHPKIFSIEQVKGRSSIVIGSRANFENQA